MSVSFGTKHGLPTRCVVGLFIIQSFSDFLHLKVDQLVVLTSIRVYMGKLSVSEYVLGKRRKKKERQTVFNQEGPSFCIPSFAHQPSWAFRNHEDCRKHENSEWDVDEVWNSVSREQPQRLVSALGFFNLAP